MNLGKAFRRFMGIPDPQPPAPEPKDERGWTEDWQVGDLARCKIGEWAKKSEFNPRSGDILRVSALLYDGLFMEGGIMASGLRFEGKPQDMAWHNRGFTKIRPDHSADEIETGIIEKIKKGARV